MELNEKKAKMIRFRKSKREEDRKGRKMRDGYGIKKVLRKLRSCLGYTMTIDNGNKEHVRNHVGNARAVMGKIWGIGEQLFKNDS